MTSPSTPSQERPLLPAGVSLTTLDNGLILIVREDHSAPVVSVQAWSRTGSINEGKWLGAGLSHVLEHMLFKGTKTRPAGRIDQEIQDAGGYMNAYTSFDRTVYYIDVPSTGARTAIDILCDIAQNATLPADELAKELDVIRREMDMCHDDPGRRSSRRLFETAYTRSPYRFTIIGYPDIFNELKPEDITAYYRSRYAPNNLFFVVAGDVKPEEVVAQIKQAFAGTKARPIEAVVLPDEPRQTAPRETIEEASIEIARLHLSWHIPDLRDSDVPLLDVLAGLLGTGRSSRLFREIREKQGLVTSIDAWTYNPGNPGLFGISAVVEPAKFAAARAAIFEEIDRVTREPVAEAEIAKVVKQYVSATLSSRKTMAGQAQDLGGSWMATNDLGFSERYLDAVRRATPAELRRVARTYLTPENRTIYALMPNGTAPKILPSSESSTDNAVQLFTLKNGLRVLVREDHRLPFVQIEVGFRGGVLAETPTNGGLTHLLAKMLLQGTAKHSAEQLANEVESLGGHIDTFGGNNSFGVTVEVLDEDFATGLGLVADVLLHPAFPADALERERTIQFAYIRAQRDQLLQSAIRGLRRTLFGPTGYGLDPLGTDDSVKALTAETLREFHRQIMVPNNCVIAIFGHVSSADALSRVEKLLGHWAPNPELATVIDRHDPTVKPTGNRASAKRDKKQAVMVVGFPGVPLNSPDRYALELVQESCSDLGSRLFVRIRDELGLAYYVGAQNMMGIRNGYFAFYCGTSPEKAALVEKELLAEAAKLAADGLTEEELRRSKNKIIGQKKIGRQDPGNFAMNTMLNELYGQGYKFIDEEDAHIEAVTLEQARDAARRYLVAERAVVSEVLGDPNGTEE
jgi:zinc protease